MNFIGLIGGLGFSELLIILVILLLLFGARRLPEIAKSIGEGLRELKKSLQDTSQNKDNNKPDKKE